jgi:hypothetical protein
MVRRSNESGLNRGARSHAPITEQGTKEPSSPWAGTESSNLAPSTGESCANLFVLGLADRGPTAANDGGLRALYLGDLR